MRARPRVLIAVLACVAALLGGCTAGPGPESGIMTIFAAPSMTEAINGMTAAYKGTYPALGFETVFEPDAALAARVRAGAHPDLIVVEDPATLVAAGVTAAPVHFARGQLVLAVPTLNPAHVNQLADLTRAGVRVALCEADTPCGRVTEAVLAAGQVTPPEGALREPDVRSALRHVTDGTADAALVYRSDALTVRDSVLTIEIGQSGTALADFVAVVPDGAPNATSARGFVNYLASRPVLDALTRDGFRPPA